MFNEHRLSEFRQDAAALQGNENIFHLAVWSALVVMIMATICDMRKKFVQDLSLYLLTFNSTEASSFMMHLWVNSGFLKWLVGENSMSIRILLSVIRICLC